MYVSPNCCSAVLLLLHPPQVDSVVQELQARLAATEHKLSETIAEYQDTEAKLQVPQHAMHNLAHIFSQEHPTRVEAQARVELLAQQCRQKHADMCWVELQCSATAADLAFHLRCQNTVSE